MDVAVVLLSALEGVAAEHGSLRPRFQRAEISPKGVLQDGSTYRQESGAVAGNASERGDLWIQETRRRTLRPRSGPTQDSRDTTRVPSSIPSSNATARRSDTLP